MGFVAYDARNGKAFFGPVELGEGAAPDGFLKIEFDDEDFTTVVGIDGSVTRCRKPNATVTITHSLMSSSSVNAKLSAIRIADRVAKNGAGVTTFLFKDLQGASICASSRCWIEKAPPIEVGAEIKMVDWVFKAVIDDAAFLVGGN